jgi:hypothetical protein
VVVYKEQLDEDGLVDFKGKAKAFGRTYGVLASILPYTNADWIGIDPGLRVVETSLAIRDVRRLDRKVSMSGAFFGDSNPSCESRAIGSGCPATFSVSERLSREVHVDRRRPGALLDQREAVVARGRPVAARAGIHLPRSARGVELGAQIGAVDGGSLRLERAHVVHGVACRSAELGVLEVHDAAGRIRCTRQA